MTFGELVLKFLNYIQVIKKLNPAYKQPGDGSNGVCDCIGLIIGALKRMGIKWPGIHGSNYAARYQTVGLAYIEKTQDLELGDIVYKAVEPDGKGKKPCNGGTFNHSYNLPNRYKKGNSYCNGDFRDYYHVGVVTSVSPLKITHMTSPHMKVDVTIGNWNYYGKCKPLVEAAKGDSKPVQKPVETPSTNVPNTGKTAVVEANNGLPVKMREYPSTSCRTWVNLPCGTKVKIVEPGETWCKIDGGDKKGWYMMAKFLNVA